MRTSEQSGSQSDSVVPRVRMYSHVTCFERMIQIVTPLCRFVHVGTEHLIAENFPHQPIEKKLDPRYPNVIELHIGMHILEYPFCHHNSVWINFWQLCDYLRVEMIAVAVTEPEEWVVAVGYRKRSYPRAVTTVLPTAVTTCYDARDLSHRTHIELNPLVIWPFQ